MNVSGNTWLPDEDTLLIWLSEVRVPVVQMPPHFPRHSLNAIKGRRAKLGLTKRQKTVSKPKSDKPSTAKMRKCLGSLCGGKEFWSEHVGMRMCRACRHAADRWCSGLDISRFA